MCIYFFTMSTFVHDNFSNKLLLRLFLTWDIIVHNYGGSWSCDRWYSIACWGKGRHIKFGSHSRSSAPLICTMDALKNYSDGSNSGADEDEFHQTKVCLMYVRVCTPGKCLSPCPNPSQLVHPRPIIDDHFFSTSLSIPLQEFIVIVWLKVFDGDVS